MSALIVYLLRLVPKLPLQLLPQRDFFLIWAKRKKAAEFRPLWLIAGRIVVFASWPLRPLWGSIRLGGYEVLTMRDFYIPYAEYEVLTMRDLAKRLPGFRRIDDRGYAGGRVPVPDCQPVHRGTAANPPFPASPLPASYAAG